MYLAFSKADNSFQRVCLSSLNLGGSGQYDWYFVDVGAMDEETVNTVVSYSPSGFTPNAIESMQTTSGGTVNYS